jgi:hypothetical protein
MSFLIATPQLVTAAAGDLASIGSAIVSANAAAAAQTTGVLPAGADSVSAAIAALLGEHAQVYRALSAQAEAFHDQCVQTLRAAAHSYAATEADNASSLQSIHGTR